MNGKGLTKEKVIILIAIIVAISVLMFIKMPAKTFKVTYNLYEEKIEFKGIHFSPEFVVYNGDTKGMNFKYKEGERVPKGAIISSNIVATESGILARYLDGYENKYDIKSIDKITSEDIDKVIENQNVYQGLKIINNSEWYIYIFIEDNEYPKRGLTYEIRIGDKYYLAEAKKIFKKPKGNYILLKLKDDLKLANLPRGLTGYIIKARYNGIMVPLTSICEYNGNKGVFVNYNGYAEFRKVKTLYQEGNMVVVVPEKSSRKKLQQYDDVIVKPHGIKEGIRIR